MKKDETSNQSATPKENRLDNTKLDQTKDQQGVQQIVISRTPPENVVYCYRWWVITAYTVSVFISSASYGTFIPFSTYFQKIYGISNLTIVLTAMIFQILYLPSSFFLANPFVNSKGTKLAMLIGNLGMIICMWGRILINTWFYWVILACIFGGITNPFTGNIATKVSSNWFPTREVVVSNTISQLGSALGSALGAFYTMGLIDTTEEDKTEAKSMIFYALLNQAVVYTIFYTASYFVFSGKPDIPPCRSAEEEEKEESTVPYTTQICLFLKNKDYIFLVIVFLLLNIPITNMGLNISPMLEANHINDSTSAVAVGASYLLVGLIGGATYSWVLAKTARFKLLLIISSIGLTISYFLCFLGAILQQKVIVIICAACAGFFGVSSQGHILSYCSQVIFPASETVSNGFLFSCYFVVLLATGTGIAILFESPSAATVFTYGIITTLIMAIAIPLSFCVTESLKKLSTDTETSPQKIQPTSTEMKA